MRTSKLTAYDLPIAGGVTTVVRSFWRRVTITTLAVGLACIGVAAIVISAATDWLSAWTPNIATEAISLLVTIAVVDRVVEKRDRDRARRRVEQVLSRVSGNLSFLTYVAIFDYADLHHGAGVELKSLSQRELLLHWKAGLPIVDVPWPDNPRILVASKALANTLEEQLRRHESVLEHDFVAASYRFISEERRFRDIYRRRAEYVGMTEGGRTGLDGVVSAVITFLDSFEPYATEYLDDQWIKRAMQVGGEGVPI